MPALRTTIVKKFAGAAKLLAYFQRATKGTIGFAVVLLPSYVYRWLSRRPLILLAEQGGEARDNSEHLYRHLKETGSVERVLFVVSRSLPDSQKIALSDQVQPGTLKHYFYYAAANIAASTHIHGANPAGVIGNYMARLLPAKKTIALRHGISKDHYSIFLRSTPGIDMFVCGAKAEYEYLKSNFGKKAKILKNTGFARYDALPCGLNQRRTSQGKSYVLFMPTFRKYLFDLSRLPSSISHSAIRGSNYYKAILDIISSPRLINSLKTHDKALKLYMHRSAQFMTPLLREDAPDADICTPDGDLQGLLIGCCTLITDFSSVFFDAAYMGTPVIYYHFDTEDYRSGHYAEGYYSYHEHGFGPVVKKSTEVEAAIEFIASNSFDQGEPYRTRAQEFFHSDDQMNCERIASEMRRLMTSMQ